MNMKFLKRTFVNLYTDPSWENIALYKKAYSRSVKFSEASPDKAVDGNRDPIFYHRSCFHSLSPEGSDNEPWWVVDLGQTAVISWVRLFNRQGSGE